MRGYNKNKVTKGKTVGTTIMDAAGTIVSRIKSAPTGRGRGYSMQEHFKQMRNKKKNNG